MRVFTDATETLVSWALDGGMNNFVGTGVNQCYLRSIG